MSQSLICISTLEDYDQWWGTEKRIQVIDVNLKGTFLVTQTAASLMKEQKLAGSIVNIASIVGRTGNIGQVRLVKNHLIRSLIENHIPRQTTQRARREWSGSQRLLLRSSASSASGSMLSCQVVVVVDQQWLWLKWNLPNEDTKLLFQILNQNLNI